MEYLAALNLVHRLIVPKNYCEIGCRRGNSLALARCPSVGIDPDFEITQPLTAPTRLYRMKSDDFFENHNLTTILGDTVDFSFIDGMHQVEFALRDFINMEHASHEEGIIAIDDVLPASIEYTGRERNTRIWTGDVYRLIPLLRHFRPDLDIRIYTVEMKGFCLITRLDPTSATLREKFPQIEAELAGGRWTLASTAEIHDILAPLPISRIEPDLREFASRRGTQRASIPPNDYLDLLKRSLLNEIYLDDEIRIIYLRDCVLGEANFDRAVLHDIRARQREAYDALAESRKIGKFYRKIRNSGFSHSMMGRQRLNNLHECMNLVHDEAIEGDLIECGVWRGGGCIFMAGYVRAHDMDRRIIVADSFDGLPPPTLDPDAGLDLSKDKYPELAVSLDTVRENFAAYGLLAPNVVFLKGWFKDTLAVAPMERIALLRMDGDLYESTMDILINLYDKVVPGGIVIVDDYNAIKACRQAVVDFFHQRTQPLPELNQVDWTGVWFRKPAAQAG